MKRREFIINGSLYALLLGIGLDACRSDGIQAKPLKKMTGGLDRKKLIFLLRRATLGFSQEQLIQFEQLPVENVLEKLFNDQPKITFPLNFEFKEDALVPIGKTWIDAPYRMDVFYEQYRKKSLRAWLISSVFKNKGSLRQQMQFFWLNFYSISDVIEHKYEYKHVKYFHDNAWGNFKQITKDVTIDPAMLRFLSGFENTKDSPNENYARELLELFTVGRGKLAGKGDYTTFTEKDVKEIAKVLTGWRDIGWFTQKSDVQIGVKFEEWNHASGEKQLSHRFDNANLEGQGEEEYKSVIDLIFSKNETAIHFTKRLYRWFCCDEISEEVEKKVILPLSQLLIENDFEVKPVLVALLSSDHFYNLNENTARIKNPLQYSFDLLNFFPISIPTNVTIHYGFCVDVFESVMKTGMELLKPPSVGGWKSYYQAPGYSKLWINSAALKNKSILINRLTEMDSAWSEMGIKIDYSKMILQSKADSFEDLYDYFRQLFFPDYLNDAHKENSKKIFMAGYENFQEDELIRKMVNGESSPVLNFKKMLNCIFNLPTLNLH